MDKLVEYKVIYVIMKTKILYYQLYNQFQEKIIMMKRYLNNLVL